MPTFNRDQYAHLWARQLLKEFQDICWSHHVSLTTPAFEIFDSTRHLGEWYRERMTIRISSQLILHHPWSVTINVLKHEMAHQLCDQSCQTAAGHGPPFQAACQRLGVPPVYRTARGDSPEVFTDLDSASQMIQEGRRFFAKVEKLLALARSANEHEAALAMQKANAMIEKYNLQQTEHDADQHYRHTVINSKKKRIHGWQRAIGSILRDFFYVSIVLAETYDPLLNQQHKTIDLFGRAENVAVAEYCYHFLARELDFLWRQNKGRFTGSGMTEKNSYYLGVLDGFHAKLKEQQAARPPTAPSSPPWAKAAPQTALATTSSLTVAADQGLNDFIAQRYPRLRNQRHAGARVNPSTYDHGTADGKKIVLHKGVGSQDGNQGRLLVHQA